MNRFILRLVRDLAPLFFPKAGRDVRIFPPTIGVDAEEADFFRRHGFLVKRDVVPTDLCARAVKHVWSLLPSHFDRHDPSTWKGSIEDSIREREVSARRGRVKFRECVRGEQWLHDMIGKNPCIRSTVRAMIGPDRTAELPYVRGMYPVLPSRNNVFRRPKPHTDHHRFLVGTLTYLSDVAPGGGGFHVWPGSHLAIRNCFKNYAGAGWTADYRKALYAYTLRNPSIEIVAPAGTTVFWHHRVIHAAGVNRSNLIRHAVLADFPSTDFESLTKLPIGDNEWAHWDFTPTRTEDLRVLGEPDAEGIRSSLV